MSGYQYSPLVRPKSIRLLRLQPREENSTAIQCTLFECSLISHSDITFYPYEAISYTWGSEYKPCVVHIDGRSLSVTRNLYALLQYLQPHGYSRVIWVDAICIKQDDDREKEGQIPFMAEIYAKATRVVVWLGDANGNDGDHGDVALDSIRIAGEAFSRNRLYAESTPENIRQLLGRPWFKRIWVSVMDFWKTTKH
jgi:hypothetical protein